MATERKKERKKKRIGSDKVRNGDRKKERRKEIGSDKVRNGDRKRKKEEKKQGVTKLEMATEKERKKEEKKRKEIGLQNEPLYI